MESRSIALLLTACRDRRDPFILDAVPLAVAAFAIYLANAILFAFVLPSFIRTIL